MRRCGKWPFYNYSINQLQAIKTLQKRLERSKDSETGSLSILIGHFRSCTLKQTPLAYSLTIKYLLRRNRLLHLPLILDHLEKEETFEVPEETFVNIIRSYGRAGMLQEAITMFYRVPNFRCQPSALVLDALLSYLCKDEKGRNLIPEILMRTPKMGIRLESSSVKVLIKYLCMLGKVRHAFEILNTMKQHDCYIIDRKMYSLLLLSLCKHTSSSVEILCFLDEMRSAGFSPNGIEYREVLCSLVSLGQVDDACSVANQMRIEGRRPDLRGYKCILDGFVSVDDFEKADIVFDEMLILGIVPDVVAYNSYINSLCKQKNFEQARRMMISMEKVGCMPDLETYNTLMDGYSTAGHLGKVREIVVQIVDKGFRWNCRTYGILVDALLAEGEVEESSRMFVEMVEKGFIPWHSTLNALVQRLCQGGLVYKEMQVIEDMIRTSSDMSSDDTDRQIDYLLIC